MTALEHPRQTSDFRMAIGRSRAAKAGWQACLEEEPSPMPCVRSVTRVSGAYRLGIKDVDDGIWLVSFMHYDLGYIDLEQKTLQTIDNPFGSRLSPMS
ncbi:MAG: hypothetical protein ABJG86_00105 [Nitratireductor sp.]|uniref:hypothetical protein n=1 Tax=Alphaproteobacteria TaxID=28211 RepID=UPI003271BADF